MVVVDITRMLQGSPLQHQLPSNGEQASSQGELDGLCGLYAGVNAIRLLCTVDRRLKRREVKRLFDAGIAFLHQQGELSGAATEGFHDELWQPLLAALIAEASAITGRTVTMTQPLAVRPALHGLRSLRSLKRRSPLGSRCSSSLPGHTIISPSSTATALPVFSYSTVARCIG